jgi:hypothetical protein
MDDNERELNELEGEFPRSWQALEAEMPRHLTERLTSLARRQALNYASEQSRLQPGLPRSEATLLRRLLRRPMKSPPAPKLSRRERSSGTFDTDPMFFSEEVAQMDDFFGGSPWAVIDEDLDRLKARDRETWLQRIAELTLRGETARAASLIVKFNLRFR